MEKKKENHVEDDDDNYMYYLINNILNSRSERSRGIYVKSNSSVTLEATMNKLNHEGGYGFRDHFSRQK